MKFFKLSILSLLLLAVFACSDTEQEEIITPDNVIRDSEGLTIRLEWSTGGTDSQAQDDVDLELFLTRNNNDVDTSDEFGFEQVQLEDTNDDGRYLVRVQYFSGMENIEYTFEIDGISSGESLTYTGTISADDKGTTLDYLAIQKSGDTYTVTEI